jgi:hypothetical protein
MTQMEPIDPRRACAEVPDPDDPHCSVAGSQAALLLSARLGVLGVTDREQTDLNRAAARGGFALPDLAPMRRERRLGVPEVNHLVGDVRPALATATAPEVQATMSVVAQALYRAPSANSAAALFEVGLHSPHPLVRVAAAAGARETTRTRPELLALLRAEVDSHQTLVATLARTVLAQIRPDDRGLAAHVGSPPPIEPRDRGSSTAVLTHGTWGAEGTWYQPGGDFYTRIDAERPDLDLHDKSFTWSGGYSDVARRLASRQLVDWGAAEGLTAPDLFAHSHGGTVGNLATSHGLSLGRLVYMGWPVHEEWFPDGNRVERVIDVRVNMDLVILVDRGGQRIRGAPFPVEEHVNGWFDHTSTHEPDYWDTHGLWGVV